jgi:uncharacterized protein YjbI with pentapeptide repeats/ABC-type Na+ efflux pump permease subunit
VSQSAPRNGALTLIFSALSGGFQAEIKHLLRARFFLFLTLIQAMTFLFLVSLFGLTGAYAPTALIDEDGGPYARALIKQLELAHHSFDLRVMDRSVAQAAIQRGEIAAIITIPVGFSEALAQGKSASIHVIVDNVNTDMTEDIQRALPSALVGLGRQLQLPNIYVDVSEQDLIDHDTGFIPYLVVSGLALDAFVIASVLSAMTVAREFESGTVRLLALAPVPPLVPILGRVLATSLIAALVMLLPVAIAIWGYGIYPLHLWEMLGVLLLSIAIFSCVGVALGALLKRTLPVASLVFGLAMPLYLCSGALEPERLDGNLIWTIAHISPVYYSVGILEWSFHNFEVTPEPIWGNFLALLACAVLTLWLASHLLRIAVVAISPAAAKRPERSIFARFSNFWMALHSGHLTRATTRAVPNPSQPLVPAVELRGSRSTFINWAICLILIIAGTSWLVVQHNLLVSAKQEPVEVQVKAYLQQDELLEAYMQQINHMLLYENLLDTMKTGTTNAKADQLTLATVRQFDSAHKGALVRFLYASKVIMIDYRAVSLKGADLRGAELADANLEDSDLSGADLSNANLQGAEMGECNLTGTNLSGANLAEAALDNTQMRDTNLSGADLTGANLTNANGLKAAQLLKARALLGAILPANILSS